jgi:integrase/recombinase XerD
MRFGRGRAESTTRKYSEAIALYYTFCSARSVSWADPDITSFQMWLRIAPSPRHPHMSRRGWAGPGRAPARSDNHINLVTYAVCEMFKFAAAEGLWDETRLGRLFEVVAVRSNRLGDRRRAASQTVVLRRRHRMKSRPGRRRDAPVDVVKDILTECLNARDVFFVALLATRVCGGVKPLVTGCRMCTFCRRRPRWGAVWRGRIWMLCRAPTATRRG